MAAFKTTPSSLTPTMSSFKPAMSCFMPVMSVCMVPTMSVNPAIPPVTAATSVRMLSRAWRTRSSFMGSRVLVGRSFFLAANRAICGKGDAALRGTPRRLTVNRPAPSVMI